MTYLAQLLKKYYRKAKKAHQFRNGLSLNQLAWEMSAKLNFSQIDPSVLCKVVNGKRLFSREQLDVLCKVLNLSGEERKELVNALQKDLLCKEGFKKFPYFVKDEDNLNK